MRSHNFNLRGLSSEIIHLLKKEAKARDMSVNGLILKYLESGLGYAPDIKKSVYHDLDHLAGTWSLANEKSFKENTRDFERIDKELWK